MRMHDYDQRAATRFTIAAGVLLKRPTLGDAMNDPVHVIFTCAKAGFVGRRDIERAVREHGRANVHLEFERWREAAGPTNVVVCERGTGPRRWWPRCSIWTPSSGGPASIVPHGAGFAFAFDGLDLSRIEEAPDGDELERGAALALGILGEMAPRVPPHLLGTMQ